MKHTQYAKQLFACLPGKMQMRPSGINGAPRMTVGSVFPPCAGVSPGLRLGRDFCICVLLAV